MFLYRSLPSLRVSQHCFHRSIIRPLSTRSILLNKHFDKVANSKQLPREPTIVETDETRHARYSKIISKLPKRLQKYGNRLIDSPIEHVVSFLTLHEISAVVPFLGLWYAFHHYGFLPADIPSWVIIKGTGFIENILGSTVADWSIQDRTKIIIEGATAYGIVKATFPIRVVGSILLTPWFARLVIEPIFNLLRRIVYKVSGKKKSSELSEGFKTKDITKKTTK